MHAAGRSTVSEKHPFHILDAKIMGLSKIYMTASVMVRNNNTS